MFNFTVRAKSVEDLKQQMTVILADLNPEETGSAQDPAFLGTFPSARTLRDEDEQVTFAKKTAEMMQEPQTRTATQTLMMMGNTEEQAKAIITQKVRIGDSLPARVISNSTHDTRGVPWDARVHASSKELTDKGIWRKRRGITPQQLHEVESQLPISGKPTVFAVQQSMTPQAPVAVIPPMPQPTVDIPPMNFAPPAQVDVPAFTQAVAQQVATIVTPAVAAQPPAQYDNIPIDNTVYRKQAHDLASFQKTLIQSLAKLVQDKKITQDYVNELKAYFQVKEIWDVANDPNKISQLFEQFCSVGLITRVG